MENGRKKLEDLPKRPTSKQFPEIEYRENDGRTLSEKDFKKLPITLISK